MAFPGKDWLGPMVEAEVGTAIEWMKSRESRPDAPSQKDFEDLYEDDGSNLRIKCEQGLHDPRLLAVNEGDSPDGSISDGYTLIKAKFDEEVFHQYRKQHSKDIAKTEGALLEISRFEIVTSLYGGYPEDSIQLLINDLSFVRFPAQRLMGNPKPAHERPKLSEYINSLLKDGDVTDSGDELLSQGAPELSQGSPGIRIKEESDIETRAHESSNVAHEASVISNTQFATQIEIPSMNAGAPTSEVSVLKGVNLAMPQGASFARPATFGSYRQEVQPGPKEDLLKLLQTKNTLTGLVHHDAQPPDQPEDADKPGKAEAKGGNSASHRIERSLNRSPAHDSSWISVSATQARQLESEPDKISPERDMIISKQVFGSFSGTKSEQEDLTRKRKTTAHSEADSTGVRSAKAMEKLSLQPRDQIESHSLESDCATHAHFTPLDGEVPKSYQRQTMSQARHEDKLKSTELQQRAVNGPWGSMSSITRSMCKVPEDQMNLLNPHLPTSWLPPAGAVDFPPGNLPISILTKINKMAEKRAKRQDPASSKESDKTDCSDSEMADEPPWSPEATQIPWSSSPARDEPFDDLPPESSLPEQSRLPVDGKVVSNLNDTVAVVDENVSLPASRFDEEIPCPAIEFPSSPPEGADAIMEGDTMAELVNHSDTEMAEPVHQRTAVEKPAPLDTAADALGGHDAVAGFDSDSDIEMAAPLAFTARSNSNVQISASSPAATSELRGNFVTGSPAIGTSTMHAYGFARRSGEDTPVSSTPALPCSITAPSQTVRHSYDNSKTPRPASNNNRLHVAGFLEDDEAERQIHDEMKRFDVQGTVIAAAGSERPPKATDTEQNLTPKRKRIESGDRSTLDKADGRIISRDPMNNVKARKRSWMQTAKQSLNSRKTPNSETDSEPPVVVRAEAKATPSASLARPVAESNSEDSITQATQPILRENRHYTMDYELPPTAASSIGSQVRQASHQSHQSRKETTGPEIRPYVAGSAAETIFTAPVAKPVMNSDSEDKIPRATQSNRRHTTAHESTHTDGFGFGSHSRQASLQSRRETIGPDLRKPSTGPAAEGGHIEATTNNEVFQTFIDTYPEYVQCKGDLKHFLGLCRMIERLEKEERMQHKSLWDDFIIRHKSDYPKYLLDCNDEGNDPVPYEKFYRGHIDEPLFTKRIMTPATLKRAMAHQGGPSFANNPSLPDRADNYIPGHFPQSRSDQKPLNQSDGVSSISADSIKLKSRNRSRYPANYNDNTRRGRLNEEMSHNGSRVPVTSYFQGSVSPMPESLTRQQEPQRPQLPKSLQNHIQSHRLSSNPQSPVPHYRALESSAIGEAPDLGQPSIPRRPSIGEMRRAHSKNFDVPTASEPNALRHSLPGYRAQPAKPAVPEPSRPAKRSRSWEKHTNPARLAYIIDSASTVDPSSSRPAGSTAPAFTGSLTPATNPLPVDKSYQAILSDTATPRKRVASVTSSRASSLKGKNAFTTFKERYKKSKPN
ncbi:hypothetical protein K490DRAFT_64311 [Saccharata proteae CBS 121410]|uniref:Telomere replication protein EST3 n=1 Tax=Saccharata proteae CBS 121410 TaxID=1314787 RepID=A0A6A5YB62_9PEZI|nr:hypothetical protein K490DRAFT_64311 [Saccharata proteae CBS 121410]